MKPVLFNRPRFFYSTTFVFLSSFFIFWGFYYFDIQTDIIPHLSKVQDVVEGTMSLGANFLYFLILYVLTIFWGSETITLYLASTIILSLAVTIKYIITRQFLVTYSGNIHFPSIFYSLYATALIFIFSLPMLNLFGGFYYRGNIPPNVWHNSTVIFLMPFALLLFWKSYEQLKNPISSRIALLSGLVVINIIIKPSYCFVFIVLYPIFILKQFGLSKKSCFNLIPIITAVTLVAVQYIIIYVYDLTMTGSSGEDSEIVIALFEVWSSTSSNIPISLLGAILFPITYICFYWKEVWNNLLMQYTVSGYIVAITIYSVFMETGSRQFHGNFGWQCIVASYILYMVVSSFFIKKLNFSENKKIFSLLNLSKKNKILIFVFTLHLLSGVIYLFKIFSTKNYY